MVAGTAGTSAWSTPALALAAVAFAAVVVAETGRQPVDNPDTHLELTMIHEGPLLEYGGRDLALLQWAAAARHWLVLVLAAQVLPPARDERLVAARRSCRSCSLGLCAGLALTETLVAKMRILLVPRMLGGRRGVGAARDRRPAAGAIMSRDRRSSRVRLDAASAWGSSRVVVVRHRSIAVGVVTVQALVLVVVALSDATDGGEVAAALALGLRAVGLAALFLVLVARTREPRPFRANARPLVRGGLAVALRARADLARARDRPDSRGRPSAACSR